MNNNYYKDPNGIIYKTTEPKGRYIKNNDKVDEKDKNIYDDKDIEVK